MPQYTLVERTTEYTLKAAHPGLTAEVIREYIPDINDYQGNMRDWSIALAKLMFPNASDSDSPWQVLEDDGGHWIIESYEIDDDKNATMVAKLYWKNSENARDFNHTELSRWSGIESDEFPTSTVTITTTVVDYNKPYNS
jgi:hypothetical protein